jgi:hypothetical protein
MTLNPGSDAAIRKGCTCPVLDNEHGAGIGGGQFWITGGCPLHDLSDKQVSDKDNKQVVSDMDNGLTMLDAIEHKVRTGLAFPITDEVDGMPIIFTQQFPVTKENIAKVRKLLNAEKRRLKSHQRG